MAFLLCEAQKLETSCFFLVFEALFEKKAIRCMEHGHLHDHAWKCKDVNTQASNTQEY